MNSRTNFESLLTAMRKLAVAGQAMASSTELATLTGASPATVKRQLEQLVQAEQLHEISNLFNRGIQDDHIRGTASAPFVLSTLRYPFDTLCYSGYSGRTDGWCFDINYCQLRFLQNYFREDLVDKSLLSFRPKGEILAVHNPEVSICDRNDKPCITTMFPAI